MKLKYYLRGIGIGVFFTTVIFMISISVHKEELGQQIAATEEVTSGTIADLQEALSETQEPDRENLQDSEMQDSSTEVLDEASTEIAENSEIEIVSVQVIAGEFSDQVCVKLKDEGLVEDAWDFNVYLMSIDYDNLIRPGTYDIPVGASYEEIADILVPWKKVKETEVSE